MESIHTNSINVDELGISYLNNWVEQKLKNYKNASTEKLLELFKKECNVVNHVVNTYLNNLTLKFSNQQNETDINSYILVERDTAKLLIITQNSLLTNVEISTKLCNSCIKLLEFFCNNRNCTVNNTSLILTGNKLFDIQRKILEQTLKSLPFILSNINDNTLHKEVLYVYHRLLDQNFSSQITLTISDNLLLIQTIIYGDKLKHYLINRFSKQIYNDDFMTNDCKLFYNNFFDLDRLSIISICVARGIMNIDYQLVNYGQDVIFLGFKPGTSMELTQMSLLGMQLYTFIIFIKYNDKFITSDITSDCDLSIRIKRLSKVLVNVWGSRARRSSHLSITIWDNLIKSLINTKNEELLKLAHEASSDALKQFYHRKRLYYTCLDLSIPIIGVEYLLKQNYHLILDLIISTGDIKSRTIATKLLRKVFKQILSEIDLNSFIDIFYPMIANIITNKPLYYDVMKFGGDLSEISQTSVTNCMLTLLNEFDDKPDLQLLRYMNQFTGNKLCKSKYGLAISDTNINIDKNSINQCHFVYITGNLSVAESIILCSSRKRNRIVFHDNNTITNNAVIIGDDLSTNFIITISRLITAIISISEITRINVLQAMALPPKILQPTFIESYLILLASKTSFTISCLENRQLQLVTFIKFFHRFKNPITKSSNVSNKQYNISINDYLHNHIKILDVINGINTTLDSELIVWFIDEMDNIMAKEFFIGANVERFDMALKIVREFITILLDEYIRYSNHIIIKAIIDIFIYIPEQLVDIGFQILNLIPSDIITEYIDKSGVLLKINGRLDDPRPLIYKQSAYLYVLMVIKTPQLIQLFNLDNKNPNSHKIDGLLDYLDLFIDRSVQLIDLQMGFLDKYFDNNINTDSRIPLATGSLYVFSTMVDHAYGKITIDVCKYMRILRENLSKLGNYITDIMVNHPEYFDCRGHLSPKFETGIRKQYYYELLGDYKFGLFGPKRVIKSVKTTFSEFVTSTIWRNISGLTNAIISLIRYIFGPDYKKSSKFNVIGSKLITSDLINEVSLVGVLIINLLLCSKHRGIIDSYANFLSIASSKLKGGYETRKVLDEWFNMVINVFDKTSLKDYKPKVTSTRSENITICLVSLFNGNSKIEDKNFTYLMGLLLSDTMYKEESIYLLYIIVRSSNLAYFLNNYIHDILYIALDNVSNSNWSISNSSSLLFSCCINYLASGSSDDILEDSFYTRHLDDFFTCKPELKELVIKSLSNDSNSLNQTAFALIFVIKFNGGDLFLPQITNSLGNPDSRIRHLAVKGLVKYSDSSIITLNYLSDAIKNITNYNLLHGLLSVVNELSDLYDLLPLYPSLETKILELFTHVIPFPILPLLFQLSYKFISFKLELIQYKYLIQLIISVFGHKVFSELSKYFEISLDYIEISQHYNIKTSGLKLLLKLSHILGLSNDLKFRSNLYDIFIDKSIELPLLDTEWHEMGHKLLANRIDESILKFCMNSMKNPDHYIPVLIKILSRHEHMTIESLNYIVQITVIVISNLICTNKVINNTLLELAIGMIQVITSDLSNITTKESLLNALYSINLIKPTLDDNLVDLYNLHLWKRLIYMLQDESPEIRDKTSVLICKYLHIWGLVDEHSGIDWSSTEDLACKLLNISKPCIIQITDPYEDDFVLFPIEPANIYRERYFG